jgi:hypothetical protein
MQNFRLNRQVSSVALQFAAFAFVPCWAQPAPMPPSPLSEAPAFEALRFFEGTWTAADRLAGNGYVQTCSWLPESRRHMVCMSTFERSGRKHQTMAVFTFDSGKREYVLHQFGESGGSNVMRGQRIAEGWQFEHESMQGQMKVRLRVRFEPAEDRGIKQVQESAANDGPFVPYLTRELRLK